MYFRYEAQGRCHRRSRHMSRILQAIKTLFKNHVQHVRMLCIIIISFIGFDEYISNYLDVQRSVFNGHPVLHDYNC